jgi:hypothetical protein
MKTLYRTLVGVLGLVGVAAQYWMVTQGKGGAALQTSSLQFFSFFTILTNLLVAAAMLAPVVAPNSTVGRFLDRPSVRTAIVGYIVIVGTVYFALLRKLDNATGLHLYFEYVLHYVIPPLFVLDWLLFVPRGEVGWRNGIDSLAYPLVYLAWTLAHGALTGWYPYPFIDVLKLGYGRVLLNVARLILAFLALELVLVALDRLIRQYQNKARP